MHLFEAGQLSLARTLVVVSLVALSMIVGFFTGYYSGTGTFPVPAGPPIQVPEVAEVGLQDVQATLKPLEDRKYEEGYNCIDYAWDAMRLLRWQGQESVIVLLTLKPGPDHALLLVPTTDSGWVFIEPQDNSVVRPQVGGRYYGSQIVSIQVMQFDFVPLEEFLNGYSES